MGVERKFGTHTHYPTLREVIITSTDTWLEGQREDGGAEGLWRIHDHLYDFSTFVDHHPGGKEWLEVTKGTDITVAFEAHHLTKTAENLLPKYLKRKAKTPRHSLLTFHENGFYKTLKRKVNEKIKTIPKNGARKSKMILDGLILATFISAIFATSMKSLVFIAGLFLAWTTIAAHNFFHQRNNWRMYAFNLSFLSYREWRISHALSHHLHPNTLVDMECSLAEPVLIWYPKEKGIMKYIACLASPIVYALVYLTQYALRIRSAVQKGNFATPIWHELIPFSLPTAMLLASNESLLSVLGSWSAIIFISSFVFGAIGFNAAHHHPTIYHHGDTVREDLDFGKFQLDAVMDRVEITGSLFLVLTTFGDHGLHHLFPTLDHALLPHLYPVFKEVCKEFGVKLRFTTQWELIKGQFQQLLKTKPNLTPPESRNLKNS